LFATGGAKRRAQQLLVVNPEPSGMDDRRVGAISCYTRLQNPNGPFRIRHRERRPGQPKPGIDLPQKLL
jgi:hypothetical protein